MMSSSRRRNSTRAGTGQYKNFNYNNSKVSLDVEY